MWRSAQQPGRRAGRIPPSRCRPVVVEPLVVDVEGVVEAGERVELHRVERGAWGRARSSTAAPCAAARSRAGATAATGRRCRAVRSSSSTSSICSSKGREANEAGRSRAPRCSRPGGIDGVERDAEAADRIIETRQGAGIEVVRLGAIERAGSWTAAAAGPPIEASTAPSSTVPRSRRALSARSATALILPAGGRAVASAPRAPGGRARGGSAFGRRVATPESRRWVMERDPVGPAKSRSGTTRARRTSSAPTPWWWSGSATGSWPAATGPAHPRDQPPARLLPAVRRRRDDEVDPGRRGDLVRVQGRRPLLEAEGVPSIGWSYPSPSPGFEALAGHIAFYPGRVSEATIDGEVVRARTATSTAAGSPRGSSAPSRGRWVPRTGDVSTDERDEGLDERPLCAEQLAPCGVEVEPLDRSISGNDASRPLFGGHSSSKCPGASAAGLNVPSMPQATTCLPDRCRISRARCSALRAARRRSLR